MALIKCPECHHEVSDTAETCPHCGYRLMHQMQVIPKAMKIYERDHKERQIGNVIGGIVSIIVGIVFFCLIGIDNGYTLIFVLTGIFLFIIGIAGIIYGVHRLRNY